MAGLKPPDPAQVKAEYDAMLRGIRAQRLGEQALQTEEDERAYQKVLQRLVRDGYVVKKEAIKYDVQKM